MTTAKQRAANRRNAGKSTGPRTEVGKDASSRNALRHGLTAEHHFVEGEDPAAYAELRSGLSDYIKPGTVIETQLLNRIAATLWRLRRVPAMEASVIEALAYARDTSGGPSSADPPFRKKRGRPPLSTSAVPAPAPHLTVGQAFHLALSNNILDKISRYDAALMNQLMRTEEQLHRSIFQRHQQTLAEAAINKPPENPPMSADEGWKKIKLA